MPHVYIECLFTFTLLLLFFFDDITHQIRQCFIQKTVLSPEDRIFTLLKLYLFISFLLFSLHFVITSESWQQQRTELHELRNTVETQVLIINEQNQRLTNSDLLVKDLYVENSQLTAAIQRLEQQRSRNNMMLQHQGVPGML